MTEDIIVTVCLLGVFVWIYIVLPLAFYHT
jgi:hypothetical protein